VTPVDGEPFELGDYRRVLFDVDGTLLLGAKLLPGAAQFVSLCRNAGIELCFGSNVSFLIGESLVDRLRAAGIDARVGEGLTGIEVLASELKRESDAVVVLAPAPVRAILSDLGVTVLEPALTERAGAGLGVVAVAGFSSDVTAAEVESVAGLIGPDTVVYVNNLDPGMVTDRGVTPASGEVLRRLTESVAHDLRVIVTGKPAQSFVDAVEAVFMTTGPTLVVGDSVPADIALADVAGWSSLLVGSVGGSQAAGSGDARPTFVATDLAAVLDSTALDSTV